MKHIKNYYVALAMMGAVLCGGLTSCSDDDDIDTEVVNGTQEALDAACKQWKIARMFFAVWPDGGIAALPEFVVDL